MPPNMTRNNSSLLSYPGVGSTSGSVLAVSVVVMITVVVVLVVVVVVSTLTGGPVRAGVGGSSVFVVVAVVVVVVVGCLVPVCKKKKRLLFFFALLRNLTCHSKKGEVGVGQGDALPGLPGGVHQLHAAVGAVAAGAGLVLRPQPRLHIFTSSPNPPPRFSCNTAQLTALVFEQL